MVNAIETKWCVVDTHLSALCCVCLRRKAVAISRSQPLPPGIPHPMGAYSVGLLRLCGVFLRKGCEPRLRGPSHSSAQLFCSAAVGADPTRPQASRGMPSTQELFDHSVSSSLEAQTSLEHQVRAALLLTCLLLCFPGFLWLEAQSRAATGCAWALFELGFIKQGKELFWWSCVVLPRPAPVHSGTACITYTCSSDPNRETTLLGLFWQWNLCLVVKHLLWQFWGVGWQLVGASPALGMAEPPTRVWVIIPVESAAGQGSPSLQLFSLTSFPGAFLHPGMLWVPRSMPCNGTAQGDCLCTRQQKELGNRGKWGCSFWLVVAKGNHVSSSYFLPFGLLIVLVSQNI